MSTKLVAEKKEREEKEAEKQRQAAERREKFRRERWCSEIEACELPTIRPCIVSADGKGLTRVPLGPPGVRPL